MSRRMTLGGLSSSALNSRTSLGPARVVNKDESKKKGRMSLAPDFGRSGLGRPQTAPSGRPSLAGGPDARRSSIFGTRPQTAKADPRPVNDKPYLNSCIRSLITYLTAHGYDHSISPKLLTTPTSKEFTHIIQFLFRKFDPNLKFTGKIEDEVPLIFKKLQYPFSISKSSLYAVGSPHTWPSLLAALAWVVELLNYEEAAEEAKAETFDQDNNSKMFFEYVGKSYQHFLAGDDQNCALLDEELARTFSDRDAEAQDAVQRLEVEQADLQAKLAALRDQPSPLDALAERKDSLLSDLEKFQGVLANLKDHKSATEKKIKERRADLEGKRGELSGVVAENEMLADRIVNQHVSAADMDRMRHEKDVLEENLRRAQEQRGELEKKVWGQEAEVTQATEDLEAAVNQYHDLAQDLEIVPETAKRAERISYAIELNRDESLLSAEEVAPVDFKGVVKPGLSSLKDAYAKRMREAGTELLGLQERQDESDAALAEQREENRAELLREELASLKTAAADGLETSESRLAEVELELEEAVRVAAAEKEALNNSLLAAMDELMSYKDNIQSTLRRVEEATSSALADIRALPAAPPAAAGAPPVGA